MKKVIGFQWYINYGPSQYVPEEITYASVADTLLAIIKYLKGTNIPFTACGIDKVENDDGFVEVVKKIVTPTTRYWEDDEE